MTYNATDKQVDKVLRMLKAGHSSGVISSVAGVPLSAIRQIKALKSKRGPVKDRVLIPVYTGVTAEPIDNELECTRQEAIEEDTKIRDYFASIKSTKY